MSRFVSQGRARHGVVLSAMTWALAWSSVAVPLPAMAQGFAQPVIIDTDLGGDDLLALAWLSAEPSLDIKAVTLSGTGLAHCDPGLDQLRAVLHALELTGVRVGCGPEVPLGGGEPFPDEWRAGADALSGLVLPPAPDAGTPAPSATALVAELIDGAAEPITFVALGPLTTLATVLAEKPDRAFILASVLGMGGALDVPGNVTPPGASEPTTAEWNFHADPFAAAAVLGSGVPWRMVTLDATNEIPLSGTLSGALAEGGDTPAASLAAALVAAEPWIGAPGATPWDALAAVALTHPDVVVLRGAQVAIETDGPAAGTLLRADDGVEAVVSVGADRAAFERHYLAGLRGTDTTPDPTTLHALAFTGGTTSCELDTGGVTTPGVADVRVTATDAPLIAVLVELRDGRTIEDLRALLTTLDPTIDPPDWMVIAAYLEATPGEPVDDQVELTIGAHALICATGSEGTAPRYLVADDGLAITG